MGIIATPRNHPRQIALRGPALDVDDRETPSSVFEPLHHEFGFTIDVAAARHNAKLPRFYSRTKDGLKQSWADERVWCNPPYSAIAPWVEKAFAETRDRCPLVAMLLPANRTEQDWWQRWIEPHRDHRRGGIVTRFVRKRIAFISHGKVDPERARRRRLAHGERGNGTPFGSVLVLFGREARR